MMAEAKALAHQLLAAIRELVGEIQELRRELLAHRTQTGGRNEE